MLPFSRFGSRFSLSPESAATAVAAVVVALVGVCLVAEPAFALQDGGLPNFDKAQGELQNFIRGMFGFLQVILIAAAYGFSFWNFFKASRGGGGSKAWLNGILLLVVGSVAIAPTTFLQMFGLEALARKLQWILPGLVG